MSQCYIPPGMTPILDLPEHVFNGVCSVAADIAVNHEQPVTILGVIPGAAVWCRHRCQFTHPESVVIIPDLVLIELTANGFDNTATKILRRNDGRTVHLFRIS